VLKLLAQRAEADVHHPVVANLGRTFGFSLGRAVDRLYWPALVMPE
jgi:hypothetical protein